MLNLFLWLRYLRKRKIVLLSITAVALSVALMIVVDSLFTGYIKALEKNFAADSGDLRLSASSIPKYEIFLKKLRKIKQIEAATPIGFGAGLLWLQSGDVREILIRGIEPLEDSKFTDWDKSLIRQGDAFDFEVPGSLETNGCWVGIGIVAEPNEETDQYDLEEVKKWIGKKVILTTPSYPSPERIAAGKDTKRKINRKVVPLRVSGIAFTQTHFGDKTLYLPFDKFQKIQFDRKHVTAVQHIKIKLTDGADPESTRSNIKQQWAEFANEHLGLNFENTPPIWVSTVREDFDYLGELHKQLAILLLIFGVVCSVTVLLIFCIFYMIVETRLKDIAIIKSCGAAAGSAAFIFLGFAGCVGIIGSALGIIIGYIVTTNINTIEGWIRVIFGLKLWQANSYMLNLIPEQLNWPGVWPIALIAVAGCCLGALIPAVVAARTRPVEILRYE